MTTIYNLRCKMLLFVQVGLIERAEYDSLFEVLCEAEYTDDVERAVQLIDKLLPEPPTGGRVYVVGNLDTVGQALVQAAHVQEQLHMSWPPVEFVGVTVTRDMHIPASPEHLARCCSFLPLDSIIRDNVPLLVKPKVSSICEEPLKTLKTPQPVPFRGYMNGRGLRQ